MLLRIDAYKKYEALHMLNLLKFLGVRLLTKGIVQQLWQFYEFPLQNWNCFLFALTLRSEVTNDAAVSVYHT